MIRMGFAALFCAMAWVAVSSGLASAEPVRIETGLIEGVAEDGLKVYRGIPFAAPPVGDLRWRAPLPAAAWDGVREAGKFAPACMQPNEANPRLGQPALEVSEDCLYLNVWTPAKSAGEKLPVLVWIHGGGFTQGATSIALYSGETLAKRGVVVVSITYRVGVFGFLAHAGLSAESDRRVSGNYGLLDQIAGLKWVKDNVAAFGGDPGRVTIFGESAGGIAVSMLAASPLAKGLFEGAISESGGSFGPTHSPPLVGENVQTLEGAERYGDELAAKLGAKTVADLRALSAQAVFAGARGQVGAGWPVKDGFVIVDDPYTLYEEGKFNDTPVLIGTNSDEGAMFVRDSTVAQHVDSVRGRYGPFADSILAAYPATTDAEAKQAARDLARDSAFGRHSWVWARLHSRTGKTKVFSYYFARRPPSPPGSPFADAKGANHASELVYVFGHLDQQPLPWTAADRAISEAMVTYWTNFAKRGDPNGEGVPNWPAFSEAGPRVMHLDDTAHAGEVANLEQLKALDAYFLWRRTPEGATGGGR